MKELLLFFTKKYKGNWVDIYKAISNKEKLNEEEYQEAINLFEHTKNYISIIDDNYPICFSNLDKPPFVLFYKGNIELLNAKNKIYLTSNFKNDIYKNTLEKIDILKVKHDCVFVSFAWKGEELEICEKLIKNNRKLILVLPCGIKAAKDLFPEFIFNENVLLLSEYWDDYHPTKLAFYARNRLLTALANKMIIISSKEKTLFRIVDEFLAYGKDIYCFQPSINEINNTNKDLINYGATMITNLNEVIN
ncbi:DNA processing protein, SMF family [[Mycoplasma] falconis]|uniref:DNA processing protein, SMF family n=1 Tax=[Mycoplasma] falconis TaxID=92403 RepID=A0A501XAW9_9BACT|nr:DNA-processing protein DprA [[Mycoplasma] falconis]TPE57735.1 DNA processing protein, SMF family [[Mycoplasma] falconis]